MSWVVPPLLVPPSLFAGAAVPAFLILGLYISCGAASGLWRGPRGVRRGVLWCSRRGSLLCLQHIIRPGPGKLPEIKPPQSKLKIPRRRGKTPRYHFLNRLSKITLFSAPGGL